LIKQTLYEKIWNDHIVHSFKNGTDLLYVDMQLLHEVTSPQAFEGIKINDRNLWRKESHLAVPDHNVSTRNRSKASDPLSALQIKTLDDNCDDFGINEFPLNDIRQGIVHVIGPEQGATLPGMTIVCGDSHTSTHGAFGVLAFGIGTSEVEHVLATQCLIQKKTKTLLIDINGKLNKGVTSKDLILYIIGKIGTNGGTGFAIEYAGDTIRSLSMEGRMTLCNMTIEAGARAGLIAVDDKTIDYIHNRPLAPKNEMWDLAVKKWKTLKSDKGAVFDKTVSIDASKIEPQVTWGTSPEMVASINSIVPDPALEKDSVKSYSMKRALDYMGLKPGTPIKEIKLEKIFLGSCTNSRIEDLTAAANILRGKKISSNIKQAIVVPGSGLVKKEAESLGLDKIFIDAGFEWRNAGCSMCLAMNDDRLNPKERCASTSNRNFEGRQGYLGRSHLVSPIMVASAAIEGKFVDVRKYLN